MKFLRDLIEQKSNDAAAVSAPPAEAARDRQAVATPGASVNPPAPQPTGAAKPERKPFNASDFYRIMESPEAMADETEEEDEEDGDEVLDEIDAFEDFDEVLARLDAEVDDEDQDQDEDADDEDEDALDHHDLAWKDDDEEDEPFAADSVAPQARPAVSPSVDPGTAAAATPGAMQRAIQPQAGDERETVRPTPVRPAAVVPSERLVTPRPAAAMAPEDTGPAPRPAAAAPATTAAVPQMQAPRPVLADTGEAQPSVEVPTPSAGRGMGRAGRAKTRLLGFNTGMARDTDPFAQATNDQNDSGYTQFPVGWLVVVDGPGRGAAFTLFNGVAQIGRGEGQTVRLDFGDNSISRENHAAIAFDAEQNTFFIGHGGKANLVRCNNMPVLSTQALTAGDRIRIGETTLRFVPLCGADFSWTSGQKDQPSHAANG